MRPAMDSGAKPLNPLVERNLAVLELSWRAVGSFESLKESVIACQRLKIPLRDWQTKAILSLIESANNGSANSGKRGRHARRIKDLEARFADYIRFLRVCNIDSDLNVPGERRKVSLEVLFELAADQLSELPVRGSASAIRASYRRVARAICKGREADYYDVGLLPRSIKVDS